MYADILHKMTLMRHEMNGSKHDRSLSVVMALIRPILYSNMCVRSFLFLYFSQWASNFNDWLLIVFLLHSIDSTNDIE